MLTPDASVCQQFLRHRDAGKCSIHKRAAGSWFSAFQWNVSTLEADGRNYVSHQCQCKWSVYTSYKVLDNNSLHVVPYVIYTETDPGAGCRECLVDSMDDGTLNLPGCVLLGKDHQHHTGQDIQDIDGSMPVYMPNGGSATRQRLQAGVPANGGTVRFTESDSDAYASGSGTDWD